MFSWQDHGKPWNSASVQCLTKSIDVDVLRIQIALILLGENDIRLIRCSCPSARILEEPLMHIFGSQNHYIEQPCKSWRVDGVCLRSGFTFHNARNTETHFGLCMATGAHSGPFLSTYRFSLYRCRLLRQTHALFCYVFIVYIIYNTPICRTPASPQKETCVQAIFFVRIICNIYIYIYALQNTQLLHAPFTRESPSFSSVNGLALPVAAGRTFLPTSMLLPVAVAAGSVGGLYVYDVCAGRIWGG